MDNPLTPEKQNALIEDALHTYPDVPIPRDLSPAVMARIQTVSATHPVYLTWNDLLLGFVLSVCLGAIWFSLNNLPPLIVAQIRRESILLHQQLLLQARWLVPVLAFGLAGFCAALTLPSLTRKAVE